MATCFPIHYMISTFRTIADKLSGDRWNVDFMLDYADALYSLDPSNVKFEESEDEYGKHLTMRCDYHTHTREGIGQCKKFVFCIDEKDDGTFSACVWVNGDYFKSYTASVYDVA